MRCGSISFIKITQRFGGCGVSLQTRPSVVACAALGQGLSLNGYGGKPAYEWKMKPLTAKN